MTNLSRVNGTPGEFVSQGRKLARRMIRRAIQDLGGRGGEEFDSAKDYLSGEAFLTDCKAAGYPDTLLDTLKDMALRSKVERSYLSREILKVLVDEWH